MAILLVMPDGDRKPEREEIDPARIEQLLELELMQKRAEWQRTKASRGNLRALSFMFLFLVIFGALVAFFFIFSSGRLTETRPDAQSTPTPAAAPE